MKVDWLGAALLFLGVSALLIALGADAAMRAVVGRRAWRCSCAFVFVERARARAHSADRLLRHPVMSRTLGVVFLVGFSLFGAIAFVPLFVQTVHGRHGHRGRARC